MIRYACTNCGSEMESPGDMAGEWERCPACGEKNRAPSTELEAEADDPPAPDSAALFPWEGDATGRNGPDHEGKAPVRPRRLKLVCPNCGRPLKGATTDMIGDLGVCPRCHAEFEIPSESMAKASAMPPSPPKAEQLPRQAMSATCENPRLKGVRGWLLLFCLILTTVSPIANVFLCWRTYTRLAWGQSHVAMDVRFSFVIDVALTASFIIFGIYAGIALWRVRSGAVGVARNYLSFYFLANIAMASLPFLLGGASLSRRAIHQALWSVVPAYIFYSIWTSYLKKSKRVRATYGAASSVGGR